MVTHFISTNHTHIFYFVFTIAVVSTKHQNPLTEWFNPIITIKRLALQISGKLKEYHDKKSVISDNDLTTFFKTNLD